MTAKIKSREELLKFIEENDMHISDQGGHAIPNDYCELSTMHAQVFEDGGRLVENFKDNMRYKDHYLPGWAVTFILTDDDKRDMIILEKVS